MSRLEFTPMEFRPLGMVVADPVLREEARKIGIREPMCKTGCSQDTIEKILASKQVRLATLKRVKAVFSSVSS